MHGENMVILWGKPGFVLKHRQRGASERRIFGGQHVIHAFCDFELDDGLYELRRAGQLVPVEPKVFDMLAYLLRHRERVVPKEELFEKLWPGEFVSDSALSSCIKAARRAVRDDGATQKVIRTVHGRGFRFVAQVSAVSDQAPPDAAQPQPGIRDRQRIRPSGFGTFVGRQRELDELNAGLDDAVAGHGRLFMLVGEPGIGKTRTAEEMVASARQWHVQVLVGRCYEGDGAPAFWPWMQAIRAYLRDRDAAGLLAAMGTAAADIGQMVPEVRERLPDLPAPAPLEADQARFRLFDSITTFLKRASEGQPLLLILDDLHWADRPSLLLLQFVAREIHDAHVVVVGTYRDVGLGRRHPLTQTLGELARVPISRRIPLHGLSQEDVARFIEGVTGVQPPAGLAAAVHSKSEGNPFFVNEIVRLLTADEHWARHEQAPATLNIPQTVREAIGRRLDKLSDACIRALRDAAVVGREFDTKLLQHLSARRPAAPRAPHRDAMLTALDEAADARIIEPTPPLLGRYRFCHALIRDALYGELSRSERTRLHREVGEAIEELYQANLDAQLPMVAHHFFQAASGTDPAKAIEYSVRAGARATGLLAYEAAANHYEHALQLLDQGGADETRRCELLLGLGDNQWRAGDISRAKDSFQTAAAIARMLGAAAYFAQAALGLGGGFRGFDLGVIEQPLIDLLEEALDRLGTADSVLRSRVCARLAVALYHFPDSLERRVALSQEAVDMAGRAGDAAAHLAALYSRHWAIWGPENLDDRLAAATAMVRLAERLGDREMALHAHRFRLIDLLEHGDIDAVDLELDACGRFAGELRQPYYLWYVGTLRAMRVLLDGRFADAERLAREAHAIGQRAQSQNVSQQLAVQLLWVRREQGRLAELEPALRGFVDQYPTLPSWRCGLAYVLSELEREADARTQFEMLATHDFARIPRNAFWLAAIAVLADVCAFLGDARRAGALYGLLQPYAQRNVEITLGAACSGSASRNLARLAATMGRWPEAGAHFEDALSMNQRIGAPHLVAHTRHEYAEMLLARRQPGDAQRAHELLTQAVMTYDALGIPSFREKAQRLLSAIANVTSGDERSGPPPQRRVTQLRPRR
ncbi:MAG: AAA family ATPase [Candidatus Binatia bacterium]